MVNNQIGYTTLPLDQRPTKYSTELCKSFSMPIIHVNADDIESVYKMAQFAIQYKQKFDKDIMIDLIGYRRYGHNELDEPQFTQPQMYEQIRKNQISSPKQYHQKLVNENKFDDKKYESIRKNIFDYLEKQFDESKLITKTTDQYRNDKNKGSKSLTKKWSDMQFSCFSQKIVQTGINIDKLKALGLQSIYVPQGFKIHPRIDKFHIQRRDSQIKQGKIDWATAEAIAFMSLLEEGYNIRISGQDVERGTFSQRHCVLIDQQSEKKHQVFQDFASNKGRFQACNSPLSEYSVLGYEYGYALESPKNLVIWEAQFGDFFNTAQVIYDTFITCSESKWLRQNSLMAFLPHGYDGAGPEHSSSRIERFLQMGSTDGINQEFKQNLDSDRQKIKINDNEFYGDHADINFQLVQPSTPANIYHIIRRQMLRDYRKPIIVSSAKTLLKNSQAMSDFEQMGEGTQFEPVLQYGQGDNLVFICSGKVQYELQNMIKDQSSATILVLEELLPFPESILKQKLSLLQKNAKICWVQDEPINCGAYTFAIPHLKRILSQLGMNQDIKYCGRKAGGSTATGDSTQFKLETQQLQQIIKDQF